MQTLTLGKSGLTVSALCLGTMTWGTQNTEAEGHAQADLALEQGVTFWDTAEMYPTNPVRAETVGRTEEIIGSWLAARGGRDRLQIATKVTGKGQMVRPGQPLSGATLRAAVEGSLRRMGTDYIDLYQLHWPNRGSYHFRQAWRYAPTGTDKAAETAHMTDVLTTAQALVAEGKIRAIGLSNESVWGAARWLHLADTLGLPRMASVQNEYSAFVPSVRYRLGRVQPDRGHAAVGVLAFGRGAFVGEIRGRRDARRHAADAHAGPWRADHAAGFPGGGGLYGDRRAPRA